MCSPSSTRFDLPFGLSFMLSMHIVRRRGLVCKRVRHSRIFR
jgi:hypothetical protein